jgi:hypothetical protein
VKTDEFAYLELGNCIHCLEETLEGEFERLCGSQCDNYDIQPLNRTAPNRLLIYIKMGIPTHPCCPRWPHPRYPCWAHPHCVSSCFVDSTCRQDPPKVTVRLSETCNKVNRPFSRLLLSRFPSNFAILAALTTKRP